MKLRSPPDRYLLMPVLFALGLAMRIVASEPVVTINLDTAHPGPVIPSNFSGLSFEVAQLLPGPNGIHYFRPDNQPLINLFRTLGIKSLRVGGNTSDRNATQLPNDADLDSFFAFAKVVNVKVIYCLRLHDGDPQMDAQTAKYIMTHYSNELDCFSIGQEPSAYPKPYSYSDYSADWNKFADSIVAAVPDVRFCGPSVHNNGAWARDFIADFGSSHHVVLITEHLYPGGAGNRLRSPGIGIDRMLGGDEVTNGFLKVYQRLFDSFVPTALSNHLPYRLEEVNNYFNGGAAHVSNTFASALWALDFMHWWTEHGAAGLNFHTGDKVSANSRLQPSKYTPFFTTTNGYFVCPLSYGIKAFELGEYGRIIPVTLKKAEGIRLKVYAELAADRNIYVTVINMEHGPKAKDAEVVLSFDSQVFKHGQTMYLTASNQNAAATSGILLGGADIKPDGSWSGKWALLNPSEKDESTFIIQAPATSAVIIKLLPSIKP